MAGTEQIRHREEELRHAGMIRLRQSEEPWSAEATQLAPTKETQDEESRRGASRELEADEGYDFAGPEVATFKRLKVARKGVTAHSGPFRIRLSTSRYSIA